MQHTIAIVGASGFVGRYLISALLEKKFKVIALSRQKKESSDPNLIWKQCDLFSRKDIQASLTGCDIAIYLAHSMIPSARLSQGHFSDYDLVLADNFARAARHNQLQQIIYLSGIIPDDMSLSRHLLSRLEVEKTLAASRIPLTTLRAGIILGPDGSSFRVMYNLVKNLPVMICPSWTSTLSNPVSIWDIIHCILFCINNPKTLNSFFDIGGATTLSYLEMMKQLAKILGLRRLLFQIPMFSPKLSRLWVTTFAQAPKDLVYPLIGSLKTHMIPNINHQLPDPQFNAMSFTAAITKSLNDAPHLQTTPNAFQFTGNEHQNKVRSIQRLETLYRFNAKEVASQYFQWMHNSLPFVTISTNSHSISICLTGFKTPLMKLDLAKEKSSDDYQLYYVKEGLLTKGKGRGRLIFRRIVEGRYTMVEVHDFTPKLPWFFYKITQAQFHIITMKLFNTHLLRLQKDIKTQEYHTNSKS